MDFFGFGLRPLRTSCSIVGNCFSDSDSFRIRTFCATAALGQAQKKKTADLMQIHESHAACRK
ncbi:hypothetical protein SCIP_0174 [Scardovia inopinata JCM 12537]|nr:hypothetical protein SCIP_0174 [Scardovia inopinata JCM 12537]